jgi:hypothetical protein
MIITKEYLKQNPSHIFVFGDNDLGVGKGGAAALRDEPNVYGFITKRSPSHKPEDYYKPEDYIDKYLAEVYTLRATILSNPSKTFLISKVGAGLANEFKIFEKIIKPTIKILLGDLANVKFLW